MIRFVGSDKACVTGVTIKHLCLYVLNKKGAPETLKGETHRTTNGSQVDFVTGVFRRSFSGKDWGIEFPVK